MESQIFFSMTYTIITKPHIDNLFISVIWQTDEKGNCIHIFDYAIADTEITSYELAQQIIKKYISNHGTTKSII